MKEKTKSALLFTGVAIASLTAGVVTSQWFKSSSVTDTTTTQKTAVGASIPDYRPDFTLSDLQGTPRQLSEWDNKILLLNFWATWCPPCRREIPDFIELRDELQARKQPFEVIGIAIDQAEPVQHFIEEIGVEYPILFAELEGLDIMRDYGNRLTTLPYTVIIDQNRKITHTFRKEVTKADILQAIEPLLKK